MGKVEVFYNPRYTWISRYPSKWYTSEEFVEAIGVVVFHSSQKKIQLIRSDDKWVLGIGRRRCAESRHDAVVRVIKALTGYSCHILPLTMETRAPIGPSPRDQPHLCENVTEPFVVNVLNKGEQDVRIVNWYVAALDEDLYENGPAVEKDCESELFNYEAAKEKLANVPSSRGLVKLAIQLVTKTLSKEKSGQKAVKDSAGASLKDPGNHKVGKISEGEEAGLDSPEDIDDGLLECEATGVNNTDEGAVRGKGKSTELRGIGNSSTKVSRIDHEDTKGQSATGENSGREVNDTGDDDIQETVTSEVPPADEAIPTLDRLALG